MVDPMRNPRRCHSYSAPFSPTHHLHHKSPPPSRTFLQLVGKGTAGFKEKLNSMPGRPLVLTVPKGIWLCCRLRSPLNTPPTRPFILWESSQPHTRRFKVFGTLGPVFRMIRRHEHHSTRPIGTRFRKEPEQAQHTEAAFAALVVPLRL